jgi:CheY-like chemotaxis protein
MNEIRHWQILLVEDNNGDIDLVREALKEQQLHCALRVAGDGAAAIDLINTFATDGQAFKIDLVILDRRLPKFDGDEVLRHLRSTEQYAQTPVILMSGLDVPIGDGQESEDGALIYFAKPSSLDEFLRLGSVIRRVLVRKHGSEMESV